MWYKKTILYDPNNHLGRQCQMERINMLEMLTNTEKVKINVVGNKNGENIWNRLLQIENTINLQFIDNSLTKKGQI